MQLLLFMFMFLLCSQFLAFAIALIARAWVWRTEPVLLRGIDIERARDLVMAQIESVNDTRFGFPTGIFRIGDEDSQPRRIVAHELDFGGSRALDLGRFALAIPAAILSAGADEGCATGLIALLLAVTVAAFLVVPMIVIGIVEIALRWLMRGRVVASIQSLPSERDTCTVTFELRGLSAYGLRKSILSGLAPPVLPLRWGGAATGDGTEPWFRDRLNLIYAGCSLLALTFAAIVIANTGGSAGPPSQPDFASAAQSQSAATSAAEVETSTARGSREEQGSASTDERLPDTTNGRSSQKGTAQTPAPGSLAAAVTHGQGFTIRRPDGNWVLDHLETQKPGYIETRWHLGGSPQIIFLVDHTPGFGGTAREGAEGVSKLFTRVSSYRLFGFGAQHLPAGEAWRWEYEAHQLHSIDTFLMVCDTGYAVRGSTPDGQWSQYAQTFEEAIASLAPEC